jgi:hypothetical protein
MGEYIRLDTIDAPFIPYDTGLGEQHCTASACTAMVYQETEDAEVNGSVSAESMHFA